VGLQPTFYLRKISRFLGGFCVFFGRFWRFSAFGNVGKMAVKLDEIRKAAERVAASHGLELVEIEFLGPAKERVLRVYLEKNAEGRALLKAEIAGRKLGAGSEAGTEIEADSETESETGPGAESESGALSDRLIEEVQAGRLSVEQLSGITHEDCAAFSRDFGVLLDVEDLIPGAEYTLEASSPGLDRKLKRAEDFKRFAGSLVKVQTFEAIRNNRHWMGRLLAETEAGTIALDLNAVKQNSKSRKAGVSTVEIALENIEKAQLVPEV
jgi:ribosome maturation factor RimP